MDPPLAGDEDAHRRRAGAPPPAVAAPGKSPPAAAAAGKQPPASAAPGQPPSAAAAPQQPPHAASAAPGQPPSAAAAAGKQPPASAAPGQPPSAAAAPQQPPHAASAAPSQPPSATAAAGKPPAAGAPPKPPPPPTRRARLEDAPPAPWSPFPLVELTILLGIVLIVLGFVGVADRRALFLVCGFALVTLAALELSLREHFSGYRSHSALLAGAAAVAVDVPLFFLTRLAQEILFAVGIAVFAAAFYALRAAFRRRTGGIGFRV